ncbi:MAG TPA: GNAT family N-acetyltransferase [Polymorphobacter sp.]|nr:GNAT family N-acetyltransferase [Polymorphobacter sp.]
MGLTPLAPDELATIVTSLEMTARPAAATGPVRAPFKLERRTAPVDVEPYRALYRKIGGPWLWFSRLLLSDAELAAILDAPTTELHVATRRDGTPIGIIELDFSTPLQTELAFFGLTPELAGHGHGAWLMQHALRRAWRDDTVRVWVHTCDLDHPGALRFYQRQGFRPYARAVETFPDPRLTGLYSRDIAPHVLLLA